MSNFTTAKDSVRISLNFTPQQIASALQVRGAFERFKVEPEVTQHNVVDLGHSTLSWKYGNILLYTNTANLEGVLSFIKALTARLKSKEKDSAEMGVGRGRDAVAARLEFHNQDDKKVSKWLNDPEHAGLIRATRAKSNGRTIYTVR